MDDTLQPFLQVSAPGPQGVLRQLDLKGDVMVIGRSPRGDVVLDLDGVSRRHAELSHDAEGWWIRDLGSVNGTFVNGERLEERHLLKIGDRIEIEGFGLLYRC
ncbi:MAG TPA: FHA domain-containing protein [Nannocystis exedens]|nr:FHA domain-containing protein [Nannocystis exedens]